MNIILGAIPNRRRRAYLLVALVIVFLNFTNGISYLVETGYRRGPVVFLGLHLPLIVYLLVLGFSDWRASDSVLRDARELVRRARIPAALKVLIAIVCLGNGICIAVGASAFPFHDVGMFRWSAYFADRPKLVHRPKYYYWQDGQAKIVDLRREHLLFLSEHFGPGFNNELTFSAAFHNRGRKETYEFLLSQLRPLGVETLWVGVHTVNYGTGEVRFDPDPVRAVEINREVNIFYGPIYIPEHQLVLYEDRLSR